MLLSFAVDLTRKKRGSVRSRICFARRRLWRIMDSKAKEPLKKKGLIKKNFLRQSISEIQIFSRKREIITSEKSH